VPRHLINGVHIRLPESTTVYSCQSPDRNTLLEFLGDFLEGRHFEVRFDHDYAGEEGDDTPGPAS
jgi:hypothetical protein